MVRTTQRKSRFLIYLERLYEKVWGYRIARLDCSLAFAFTRHGAEFCPQRVHFTFLWITLSISLYKYDHIHPQILPTSRT